MFPIRASKRQRKRGVKRKPENDHLPRNVFLEKTRHETFSYYFRVGHGRRIRLPPPESEHFEEAYRAAVDGGPSPEPIAVRKVAVQSKARQDAKYALKNAVRQARNRARRKRVAYDLTEEWVIRQVSRQKYRCALSGVPFYLAFDGKTKHNPYAPSLDRIVPALGYTIGNVRIVCFAMNMMMADWGEEVVHRVADGYRYKRLQAKKKRYRPSLPMPA